MTVRVLAGDCLVVLDGLEENSIDAIVCDPPYHLTSIVKRFGKAGSAPAQYGTDGAFARASRGFMGKEWDGGDVAFRQETWERVLRVLKPGGHLVAFSGTRTYHRMVCAIEDAGFDVRDQLAWVYGSGFPKSHNVAVAIDKMNGIGPRGKSFNMKGRGERAEEFDANGREFLPAYEAQTDAARDWQGWGTALKPAYEPICLARKPLSEGTVAANVLRWGTGALNIDATRVSADDGENRARPPRTPNAILGGGKGTNLTASEHNTLGRWPANLCHDGSEEVLAGFPYSKSVGGDGYKNSMFAGGKKTGGHGLGDEGSAARFFYQAKASKTDRAGSRHPTVKPVSLMRWLVRMVTPPGGVVLDPFAGSGTTGQAAMEEGFDAVLIEREAEYVADIERRLSLAKDDAPLLTL